MRAGVESQDARNFAETCLDTLVVLLIPSRRCSHYSGNVAASLTERSHSVSRRCWTSPVQTNPWNREPKPFREGRAFALPAKGPGEGEPPKGTQFDVSRGSPVQLERPPNLEWPQPESGEGPPDTWEACWT